MDLFNFQNQVNQVVGLEDNHIHQNLVIFSNNILANSRKEVERV